MLQYFIFIIHSRLATMALRKLEGAFTPAQQVLTRIRSMLPRLVTSGVVVGGEPILYVEPEHVPTVLTFLRDHSGTACKQLTELTALDIPSREKRFEVCIPHLSPSLCTSRLLRHHSRMASCVAALLTDDPPPPLLPPPTLAAGLSAAQPRPQQSNPRQDTRGRT